MPLDAYLNQDVQSLYDFHKTLSDDLPENYPKKFSGSTLHWLASSYLMLSHPVSVTCVLDSLETVRGAWGYIIDKSSAKQKGRGYKATGLTTQGGEETKQS